MRSSFLRPYLFGLFLDFTVCLFHGLMNANHFFSRLVASPFSLNSVYFGWFCFDLFVHSLLYPGLFQASTWLSHQVISYFFFFCMWSTLVLLSWLSPFLRLQGYGCFLCWRFIRASYLFTLFWFPYYTSRFFFLILKRNMFFFSFWYRTWRNNRDVSLIKSYFLVLGSSVSSFYILFPWITLIFLDI